jgi:hypothetical protein
MRRRTFEWPWKRWAHERREAEEWLAWIIGGSTEHKLAEFVLNQR